MRRDAALAPSPRRALTLMAALVAACAGIGCREPAPPPARTPVALDTRWFRAALINAEGVEFPFLLELPDGDRPARFRSGSNEALAAGTVEGDRVTIAMPVLRTSLTAVRAGDHLRGEFTTSTAITGPGTMTLVGEAIPRPHPAALAVGAQALPWREPDLGPTSSWRLELAGEPAQLVLQQPARGAYAGVLISKAGELNYLGGTGVDDQLVLSGFDGSGVYRLELTVAADLQRARGRWRVGQTGEGSVPALAQRDPRFALPPRPRVPADLVIDLPELDALAGRPALV